MANTILYTLAMIPYANPNQYDTVGGVISLFIAVVGLWFIYICNGGKNGKRIIERYISIGWVIAVRFVILLLIPALVVAIILQEMYMGGIPEETSLFDVVFIQAFSVIYILWVAKHVNHVAKQSNA